MNCKKVISFFLMLVLSIQLLPLKQMVSWLISNQVTEEIVHSDSGKSNAGPDEVHKFVPGTQHVFSPLLLSISQGSIHHDAVVLIARHADDIPTPPPNC
jgi:hypothetical protein